MSSLIQFALTVVVLALARLPAHAGFTSFHIFGDSLSCTASNTSGSPLYYGKRYSNGRIWVEVLAQQQGLAFNPSNNPHSFFGNTSSNIFAQTIAYTPPSDASNALVVLWVNNADLYFPALDPSPTLGEFTNIINLALTNQFRAVTNLWGKGIRTLVMPNVVDISTVPTFNAYTPYTNLFHQASTNYNALFYAMLDKARTNCPGLTIVAPDYFGLLSKMLAVPASYGLTNALTTAGLSIDALNAVNYGFPVANTNGYGTNYIFWDYIDPTAKVHSIMASLAQQLVSPVKINQIATLDGSNRLDIVNVPIGQSGQVLTSPDLGAGNWMTNLVFSGTNAAQSVFVPATGTQGFYKLNLPLTWTWP